MSQTTQTVQQEHQNAHVIAKMNEDFYKTSKVTIPSNYGNRKQYSDRVLKVFEEFKREFTYESQSVKTEISYLDMEADYTTKRRQVFSVKFEQDLKTCFQSQTIYKRQMKRIEKLLPNGFSLDSFSTNLYHYESEDAKKWFGDMPSPKMQTVISYEKVTKERGI